MEQLKIGRKGKARIEDDHIYRVYYSHFIMFSIFLISYQFFMML